MEILRKRTGAPSWAAAKASASGWETPMPDVADIVGVGV
jgi:hypothetical protein